MRVRRFFCKLLVCVVAIGCLGNAGNALAYEEVALEESSFHESIARATNSFNWNIAGNEITSSNISFSLDAQETVTINASYTPFSASVDFGLISSNGSFYYVNVTSGNVNKTIR